MVDRPYSIDFWGVDQMGVDQRGVDFQEGWMVVLVAMLAYPFIIRFNNVYKIRIISTIHV